MNKPLHGLFPLSVLGLLAGLTSVLQWYAHGPEINPPEVLRHTPDTIITLAEIQEIGPQGNAVSKLKTRLMQHYRDDDSTSLDKPVFERFRPDAPTTVFQGDSAHINADSSEILLEGNILIQRPAGKRSPHFLARMENLKLFPDDARAETTSPVFIERGASTLSGIGFTLDDDKQHFELHQSARLHYSKGDSTEHREGKKP